MTVDIGQFEGGTPEEIDPGIIPIPVHLIADDTTAPTRVADYGSGLNFPVPMFPQYVQVLQRSPNRLKAVIRNPLAPQPTQSNSGGQFTDPAAGTTLASLTLPAGTYTVNWTVGVSGTLSTNDTGNFGLNAPGLIAVSNNPEALGSFAQPAQVITLTAASTVVAIKNFALPSNAATVYLATLTVQANGNVIVISSSLASIQQGIGFQMEPGSQQELKNQQPWYAAGLIGSGFVNVLDERWERE